MQVKFYNPAKTQKKSMTAGNRKGEDSYVVCDYCYMSGHLRDECYCIHGYPSLRKLFGKPRSSVIANVTASGTTVLNCIDGDYVIADVQSTAPANLQLFEGRCRQLIQMLQKMSDTKTSGLPTPSNSKNSGN